MIDLQEYVEFPVPGSGRALPMVSVNEKGLLTRNRAFLVETGGVEEFRAYIHKTGWQILLFPQGEPNLCFRKSGARNKELARQLRGQGYSFPVRYDFQWDQESQAWVGTCREMGEPPALSPEKTIGRGKGGRKRRTLVRFGQRFGKQRLNCFSRRRRPFVFKRPICKGV